MKLQFKKSVFTTDYSFSSARTIIRTLSDAFSRQYCDVKQAPVYAAEQTEGRCLYCGQPLYSLKGNSSIPVFSNILHYDHIYPASNLNLFEVGNVVLACETCNLAKSNRMPMEYYDMRVAEGGPLLIYDREEFEKFLDKMTAPYREKWPKHFEVNFLELNDQEFKDKLTELLYNDIDISSMTTRYNHEHSVNWDTWKAVIEKGNNTYTSSTAKDIEGRIGYTNEMFENTFGSDKKIEDCTVNELSTFVKKLLLSKYDSKNEVQKYRMLTKILTEVLNEEHMEGKLDGFYEKIPTYSKMNKDS